METATLEAIQKSVAEISEFAKGKLDLVSEEQGRLKTQVASIIDMQKEARRRQLEQSSDYQQSRVLHGHYAGWNRSELAFMRKLVQRHQAISDTPAKARMYEDWEKSLTAAMDSTTSGSGDELVPTQEARQLWMDVNLDTLVWQQLPLVQMPSNPFDMPLQLGDINFYPGVQNVAAKSTDLSTNKKTITAYELVGIVAASYDLSEEAAIAFMDELRMGIRRNASEVLDDVLLNADTTVTNGINSDGATIANDDAGKAQWRIGFDGLRHLPLVDATGQATAFNAAPTDAMFGDNLGLMGKYGIRPSQVLHIIDIFTYLASLDVGNFRTLDKMGPNATLITGQLASVAGIPVIISEFMRKADTDGKVTDGGNVADTGTLLTINKTQWRRGQFRDISLEPVVDPEKRQNRIVVSMKVALQQREPTIGNATHTAMQYDITI